MSKDGKTNSEGAAAGRFKGIFVPADVVMSKSLTDTAKLVYGAVHGICGKGGTCSAKNMTLARFCGSAPSTVSRALTQLCGAGLVRGQKTAGGRRVLECVGGTMPETQGGVPNQQAALPNQQGDLIDTSIDKNVEEVVDRFPSEKTEACEGMGEAMGTAEVFRDWCQQVLSMMRVRDWECPDPSTGSVRKYWLGIPEPVVPTPDDVRRFEALAQGFWPGADAVSAARRLLRSCSQGRRQLAFIQQYACAFRDSRLSLANLMAMGKKGDEGRFLADAATASVPVPVVPRGDAGLAQALSTMSYIGNKSAVWELVPQLWMTCFREAAYLCNEYLVDPSEYAACAYGIFEAKGRDVPLPWIMSELQKTDLEAFAAAYACDRMHAWSGGPRRRRTDPNYIPGADDCYGGYCGVAVARAAAAGVTAFRSRQCLMCAAMELISMPGLTKAVTEWKGTAPALVDRLLELHKSIRADEPPVREEACGQHGRGMPSLKRCRYGNTKGLYVPCPSLLPQ